MTRLASGVVIAALLLLLAAVPVFAHAELEQSDPAEGETITTPYTLTATFSEEFGAEPERNYIRIKNADGDIVAEGGQSPDDPTMMTADLPALPAGEYTVQWQTVTPDDNGVEHGTFTFNVAPPPATASPSPTPSPTVRPSSSAPPTAAPPTAAPAPAATPVSGTGQPATGSGDTLLALALAAVVLAGLGAYLFMRSRR